MRPLDVNTPWADLLVDRFAGAGVRHVVVSPGSRSTALVLAAARHPKLELHTIVDERSAAFFALGISRLTRKPALLLCTSGTAAAHYYPALIEASQSATPLLVLTADRPPELHHRAAPQTVDQVKLFGGHVRRYFELGAPQDDPAALAGLGGTVALAFATSLAPSAGPVHLNAWFRKPFEPVDETAWNDADRALRAEVDALKRRPVTRRFAPRRTPMPQGLFELLTLVRETPRGVIVCGPGPLLNAALRPSIEQLAAESGYPLLVEAASQLRFAGERPDAATYCDFFDPLLRDASFLDAHAPELVIQVGAPPTSKGFETLLERRPETPRWILTAHGWNDPFNQATGIIAAGLAETLGMLGGELARYAGEVEPAWTEAWRAASDAVGRALAHTLASADGRDSEAAMVRALVDRLPAGTLLVLGNSLPVRELDLFCPGGGRAIGVLAQRGANGIDGLLSGAAGVASVASDPVVLLTGDVSFAHDAGGLAACAAQAGRALTVVVINNGGGRLFELLPIAERPALRDTFDAHFLTPPVPDIGALARAYGIAHARLTSPAELTDFDASAPGPRVVELVVDGSRTRALHAAFLEAARAAVAGAR